MSGKFYHSDQRRLRANRHVRELAATVTLSHLDFIQPLFIDESIKEQTPIATLSGINSETIASAIRQIGDDLSKGITKFLIFPVPDKKSEDNFDFDFAARAIREIKAVYGEQIWIAADVCLCAYTSHGHCGVLSPDRSRILNHETVATLAGYSLTLASAGADCIAPSDLMDGRIAGIRSMLNDNGFDHISIMSYSAKFSSAYYGPFRDACKSTPGARTTLKDRRTYQLSPLNPQDAIATSLRDEQEGADWLMVKPALINVDILVELKRRSLAPLAAYHVSGEYQSIELLAGHGIIQRDRAHLEVWTTLKRAGASCIISYASRFAKEWIGKIEY